MLGGAGDGLGPLPTASARLGSLDGLGSLVDAVGWGPAGGAAATGPWVPPATAMDALGLGWRIGGGGNTGGAGIGGGSGGSGGGDGEGMGGQSREALNGFDLAAGPVFRSEGLRPGGGGEAAAVVAAAAVVRAQAAEGEAAATRMRRGARINGAGAGPWLH
jgi:hypothetical protein